MIIVESVHPQSHLNLKKPLLYFSTTFLLILIISPALIALNQDQTPTGSYLNPLPQNELAASPTPTISQPPEQLILTAQAYLEKAINLSQKQPQTDPERQQIITYLNSGLDYANQAVTSSPNSPQTYLIRARILASSTSIRKDATQLAQKDLETAQLLSNGQSVSLPTQVNLINYTPTEQASVANNIIIAAPGESNTSSASATTNSNITKKTATIRAHQTNTTINDSTITTDSYLYLIPIDASGQTPYVQSKTTGSAIIAVIDPQDTNLSFEYWIVNP